MQKLWCTSFHEFKKIALKNNWDKNVPNDIAIISINNGKDANCDYEYHVCDGENVLNLNFDDADPTVFKLGEDAKTYTYESRIEKGNFIILEFFTNEMAKQSLEFIENHINNDFYIHCSAGVSRSQAFVKFIKNMFTEHEFETNPNNPCSFPNGFVYSKLTKAFREKNNI